VLPQGEWERRTGFRLGELARLPLPPLSAPPGPAPTPPAAPLPTPAPGGTPAPTPAPVASPGAEVRFTVPPGRDWTDVSSSLATLTRLVPSGTLQGERPLGVWRRSTGDGPYAYLQAMAIELAPHPEVTDVASLTELKRRFLRNDSDAFAAGPAQPTTVGGQPALWFESEATRRFPGGDSSRGSVSAADVERYVTRQAPGRPVTELIWYARDVLTIQGGRGYAFRLFAAGPGVRSEHVRDLEQLLASVTFGD
jgi:hypothetical protein